MYLLMKRYSPVEISKYLRDGVPTRTEEDSVLSYIEYLKSRGPGASNCVELPADWQPIDFCLEAEELAFRPRAKPTQERRSPSRRWGLE